jgi:predicted acetyltransferase
VDVGTALAGRRYSAPVDVVIDVSDEFCPWNAGRWRLCGDTKGATCARTTASADIELGARELGAAYLGGTSLRALGAAGLVTERATGALEVAASAFTHDPAPFCVYTF